MVTDYLIPGWWNDYARQFGTGGWIVPPNWGNAGTFTPATFTITLDHEPVTPASQRKEEPVAIMLQDVAGQLADRTGRRGLDIPWPFAIRAGNLRGEWVADKNRYHYLDDTGELTEEERGWLGGSIDAVDYIVIGYPNGMWGGHPTPLAWHTPGGWHVISRRLDVPLLRYQRALHLPGSPIQKVNGRWNHAPAV